MMNTTRSGDAMEVDSVQARPDNPPSAIDLMRPMSLLHKKRVAVLVSGLGICFQNLVDACSDPSQCIGAEVVLCVSSNPKAFALRRARRAGVPFKAFNHKEYDTREEFDHVVSAELEAHNIDIVCLAGFNRILSSEFVKKWKGRVINCHPSLLPRHPGMNPVRQCLLAGDQESGCTVHFVDEGVDTGPIITQECVPVLKDDKDNPNSLITRLDEAEKRAYTRALRLLAAGRVRLGPTGKIVWQS